jgi:hypothetical protein
MGVDKWFGRLVQMSVSCFHRHFSQHAEMRPVGAVWCGQRAAQPSDVHDPYLRYIEAWRILELATDRTGKSLLIIRKHLLQPNLAWRPLII